MTSCKPANKISRSSKRRWDFPMFVRNPRLKIGSQNSAASEMTPADGPPGAPVRCTEPVITGSMLNVVVACSAELVKTKLFGLKLQVT